MGVYIKISIFAESKLFKKKAELAKQFKFPLFSVGDKYIYADKPTLEGNTDIILRETDTNVYEIDGLIPAQGTYLDITTGDIVTRQMSSSEFKAACYSKYFKVSKSDDGKITLTVSPDAPSRYTSGLLSCAFTIRADRICCSHPTPKICTMTQTRALISAESISVTLAYTITARELTSLLKTRIRPQR